MNFLLTSLIIFVSSLLGLVIFIWRKLPVLAANQLDESVLGDSMPVLMRKRLLKKLGLENFSFEILLQKIISKIRIISLKTDQKTFVWLRKLREKNQKKRLEDANYWERIEDSTQDTEK
jgi:hypothetical protein